MDAWLNTTQLSPSNFATVWHQNPLQEPALVLKIMWPLNPRQSPLWHLVAITPVELIRFALLITAAPTATLVYQVSRIQIEKDWIWFLFVKCCDFAGCQFGDRSKLLGFPKSWVQLPTPSTSCYYNSCNEVCYCNGKGELQQCHSPPLQPFEACRVGQQQFGLFKILKLNKN